MISPSTIKVFPAQVAYPATKKQLLPDFRDVFPSGFGSKEPYAYPEGTTVINPTASVAQAFAAQTGPSGGGVVHPSGQVIDTTKAPPGGTAGGGGLSDLLGSINISGKGGTVLLIAGGFIFLLIIVAVLARKGGPIAPKRRRRRRR